MVFVRDKMFLLNFEKGVKGGGEFLLTYVVTYRWTGILTRNKCPLEKVSTASLSKMAASQSSPALTKFDRRPFWTEMTYTPVN